MKTSSLLSSLGALCLLLSLCAATASADDSPAAPRLMTEAEKAAASAAVFEAFKSGDAPALAAMSLTYDEMKAQCPGAFDAKRFADAIVNASDPKDIESAGGRDAMSAQLIAEHPGFLKDMESLKPEPLLEDAKESLESCRPIDFSSIKVTSVEGADSASPKAGMDALCAATSTPLNDLKITLEDGSTLELDNPVVVNGAFKAFGGVSCRLNYRSHGSH
jgi:hypothetical protein